MENQRKAIAWPQLGLLLLAKFILHFSTNGNYSYHRDELLYLELGNHPAFGHWSNGPLIGWISWFVQHTIGDSPFMIRFLPMLLGSGLMILAVWMARDMGGGKWAQFIAGLSILVSPMYLRASTMFQPVIFDVFFWTIFTFLLVRFIQSQDKKYILAFGVAFGLSLLNKYTPVFYLFALIIGLLLSSYRSLLWKKETGIAAGIALLIFMPNLLWQYAYNFPVIGHMEALSATQLVNINPLDFLLDQLLLNMPAILLLFGGLFFFFSQKGKAYRLLSIVVVGVVLLFLITRGKSYYTAGIYPALLAAGAVGWERWAKPLWTRIVIPLIMVALIIPFAPLGVFVLPLDQLLTYGDWVKEEIGLDGPWRWEDGKIYDLPQDFADMNGWQEIAALATTAFEKAESPSSTLLYAENYGQAGAINLYGRAKGLPHCNSFSDNFRLWIDPDFSPTAMIYINDELGTDVADLFEDIQLIGELRSPYARENGAKVFLCQKGTGDVASFWQERVKLVNASWQDSK